MYKTTLLRVGDLASATSLALFRGSISRSGFFGGDSRLRGYLHRAEWERESILYSSADTAAVCLVYDLHYTPDDDAPTPIIDESRLCYCCCWWWWWGYFKCGMEFWERGLFLFSSFSYGFYFLSTRCAGGLSAQSLQCFCYCFFLRDCEVSSLDLVVDRFFFTTCILAVLFIKLKKYANMLVFS